MAHNPQSARFGGIATWIIGITSVLVVVPALINAGADVWTSLRNLPRSTAEKTNVELFERHFGNSPLHRGEIPVTTRLGTVNMELEVHKGGDIFVRYGEHSQWFHSPLTRTASKPGLFASAHAASSQTRLAATFKQFDSRKDGEFIRRRHFEDGTTEIYIIDPKTGRWHKRDAAANGELPIGESPAVPVIKYPEIKVVE